MKSFISCETRIMLYSQWTILSSSTVVTWILNSMNHPIGVFATVCTPKATFNIPKASIPSFPTFKFHADILFFQVCHFLGMPKCKCNHMQLYLARHYSITTGGAVLFHAAIDWADTTLYLVVLIYSSSSSVISQLVGRLCDRTVYINHQ